jgi:hypothetical protein
MGVIEVQTEVVHIIRCDAERILELRALLDRALNTLEPNNWPAWVAQLDREVDRSIEKLAAK